MAGTDTTSTSITYLFWELSRRPDIMKKLQAELDEAIPDCKALPDMNVLQSLPYFSAFMKEGTFSLFDVNLVILFDQSLIFQVYGYIQLFLAFLNGLYRPLPRRTGHQMRSSTSWDMPFHQERSLLLRPGPCIETPRFFPRLIHSSLNDGSKTPLLAQMISVVWPRT